MPRPLFIVPLSAVALLAAFAGVTRIHAQDTLRIPFNEGARRAATGAPNVLEARVAVARARAGLNNRGVFPAPLELEGSYRTDAPFAAEGEGGFDLAIRQEIDLAGTRSSTLAAARTTLAVAEAGERTAERDAVLQYRLAVARLVTAEDQLLLADTLFAAAVRLDALAQRLVAGGEMAQLDATTMEVDRLRAAMEHERALTELTAARVTLAALLDAPITTTIVIPDARESQSSSIDLARRAHLLLDDPRAVPGGRRGELAALDSAMVAQQLLATAAQRSTGPRLTLGLDLSSEASVFSADDLQGASEMVRAGFGTLHDRGLLLGLGATLTLPIAGLHDRGEIEAGRAEAERVGLATQAQLLTRSSRAQLAEVLARMEGATRRLTLYESRGNSLDSTIRSLVERGLSAGELNALEVITRRDAIVRLREEAIAARREVMEATAEIERLLNE